MFIKKYEATTHIIYKIFGIKFKIKKIRYCYLILKLFIH